MAMAQACGNLKKLEAQDAARRQLEAALKTREISEIQAAIRAAEEAKLPPSDLALAKKVFKEEFNKVRARESLANAIKSRDIASLQKAIQAS
eukprot:5367443-Karenia_brevis.AAC.1